MKLIDKASILQRLVRRFSLRETGDRQSFIFSETIVPTSNVDELLKRPSIQTQDATGVASAVLTFTVPANERWIVYGWEIERANAATGEVSVADPATTDLVFASAASGTRIGGLFTQPFPVEAGWEVIVSAGTAAAGDITAKLLTVKEDAF